MDNQFDKALNLDYTILKLLKRLTSILAEIKKN